MANWQVDGETFSRDVRPDRIAAGTVGDDHVVRSALTAKSLTKMLRVTDPAVSVTTPAGAAFGWFYFDNQEYLYRFGNHYKAITAGCTMSVSFTGTTFAMFGVTATNAGKFDTYIDGTLYAGVTNTRSSIAIAITQTSSPTTILAYSTAGFPTSGVVQIDDEQFTYSGLDGDGQTITGVARAGNGTVAAAHKLASTIYSVSSTVDTYSAFTNHRQQLWTAKNLTPGNHTFMLVLRADKNASSSGINLFVDSFSIGGVIGADNLNLYSEIFSFGSIGPTDGSGNISVNFPGIGQATDEITRQMVGILGIDDDSHSLTYHVKKTGDTITFHGAATTSYTNVTMTIMWLGPSI